MNVPKPNYYDIIDFYVWHKVKIIPYNKYHQNIHVFQRIFAILSTKVCIVRQNIIPRYIYMIAIYHIIFKKNGITL